MIEAAIVALALLLALGGGVVLYLLVRAEARNRRVMGRDEAEDAARRDRPEE